MSTPVPVWWPEVVAAADRRRHVTGLLLAHATPTVVRGRLRLTFPQADLVTAWHDSGAQDALDAALKQHKHRMTTEVRTLTPQEA